LLTDKAFYIIMRSVKKQVVSWSITRRCMLNTCGSISVSMLADSFVVVHVPGQHDAVLE
jgi:hypothetical protein